MQSGPHAHDEQVQLGLAHSEAGWPHAQTGPHVQGEHAQLGLAHPPACSLVLLVMVCVLSMARHGLGEFCSPPPGFHYCLSDQHQQQGRPEGGVQDRKRRGDETDRDDGAARGF